jgi:hypothetical protein
MLDAAVQKRHAEANGRINMSGIRIHGHMRPDPQGHISPIEPPIYLHNGVAARFMRFLDRFVDGLIKRWSIK